MDWGSVMTLTKSVSAGLIDLAVHLTDFFLGRLVEGLQKEATMRHALTQGTIQDKDYCAKLCTRTNSYDMCNPSLYGNDTHTFQNCMDLINSVVSATLLENYTQFAKYRLIVTIVFFVLVVVVFIRCLKHAVCLLCGALGSLLHWIGTSKEQRQLESSIALKTLQVKFAKLDAYHKCIMEASAENRFFAVSKTIE
jgi:hypothetical protein